MARRNLTFRAAKNSCAGVALIFLGLATMVGCQGFSAAKPATTQPAQVGGLVLSGASLDFGSVTAGTSKTLTLSASNTSAAAAEHCQRLDFQQVFHVKFTQPSRGGGGWSEFHNQYSFYSERGGSV